MLSTMNARAKHLLDEAMTLTTAERAELASKLLASLDDELEEGETEESVEKAWAAEIEKRAADALAGVGVTHDAAEVFARIRAGLRARE
jgi:putative addiction module component (TIGR02574 family)